MRKNWKKFRSNIPNKLHIGYSKYYEILWSEGLGEDAAGRRIYGLTRFNPNQIIIDNTQSDKESVLTTWHEALHALSDAHEINLTETQVQKLEKSFPYIVELILTLNGSSDKIRKRKKK